MNIQSTMLSSRAGFLTHLATVSAEVNCSFRHKDVVRLLRKTGAHFSRDEMEDAGTEMCSLASSADLEGLEIWHLAGVDLTMSSYDGQTPIEVARASGLVEVVDFLQQAVQYRTQPVFEESEEENGEFIEFTACPTRS